MITSYIELILSHNPKLRHKVLMLGIAAWGRKNRYALAINSVSGDPTLDEDLEHKYLQAATQDMWSL